MLRFISLSQQTELRATDTGDLVTLYLLLLFLRICFFYSSGKPPSCLLSSPSRMSHTLLNTSILCITEISVHE